MLFKVYGIRHVDFVDSKSGANITGTSLYVGRTVEGVLGVETSKVFIKSSIDTSNIKLNDLVDIAYNMYGKVDSISIKKSE